jgi:hypothetical protein
MTFVDRETGSNLAAGREDASDRKKPRLSGHAGNGARFGEVSAQRRGLATGVRGAAMRCR